MVVNKNSLKHDIEECRNVGKNTHNSGFFEVDANTECITWSNAFLADKLGMSVDQIKNDSMFSIICEDFHESITEMISENYQNLKYSVWPFKTKKQTIVWLYTTLYKYNENLLWYKADVMCETELSGIEYVKSAAILRTVNKCNNLCSTISEFKIKATNEFEKLNRKDEENDHGITELNSKFKQVSEQLDRVIVTLKTAVDASMDTKHAFNNHRNEMNDQLSRHTTEILRLIGSDTHQDERFKEFEKRVGDSMVRSNEKISKTIVVPVAAVTAFSALIIPAITWLIQHWPR